MEGKEVQDLFHSFNQKYFWGKLSKVSLRWSKNMTLCTGKTYCKLRRGTNSVLSVAVYLSQPLLTQRPPEDTVNTLLHEMIHAYLFVMEGSGHKMGHGPAFREHMTRINKLQGSKITVFHNFTKEVDKFRVHVYRCDGPCTKKRPYYGVLKRAITRPPGPSDRWWAKHSQECGGTFHKVEGPDITPDSTLNANKPMAHNTNKSVALNNTSKSLTSGSVGYPNTSSSNLTPPPVNSSLPKHTPSSQRGWSATYTPPRVKRIGSSSDSHSQEVTPVKPTHTSRHTPSEASQTNRMAARHPGDDGRETFNRARKRLAYDAENADQTVSSEDQLVQKIKQRHAHTNRSVLLSKEETRMIWRGRSPERGTPVEGRVNYNYRPKSRGNLNIQKYLDRFRAYKEGQAGRSPSSQVLQSPQASPSIPKSSHQNLENTASWGTKAGSSSHMSFGDASHASTSSRAGGSSSQASTVPPCVTCWNCGVNVMVPERAYKMEGNSIKPVEKKLEKIASPNLVDCPSCAKQVVEEELNKHLDECLLPFTDDF